MQTMKSALRERLTVAGNFDGDSAAEQIVRSAKSLKLRIVLFSIAIALVTAFLVGELLIAQRDSALERARFEAANLSAGFEDEVHQVIANVSAVMERIKSDIEARDAASALEGWSANRSAGALPAEFTATGPDGTVLASTFGQRTRHSDLSDRDYFKVFEREPQRGLLIGKLIIGRTSGKVKIPLAVEISGPDGSFGGVLVATLDAGFLSGFYQSADLGRSGSLLLMGTDGAVRAFFSAIGGKTMPVSLLGKSAEGMQALRDSQFDSEGTYEQTDPMDGVQRIFHWRKVRGYPLLAIAGIGKMEALSEANKLAVMSLGVGSAALILALLMPLMLVREISKRMTNEISLSRQRAKLSHLNRDLAEERQNLRESNSALDEARRIAEQASEAKSRFLMNMSHEFRTPMHAILNYTSMCLKCRAGDPKLYKYIENTRAAGVRLLGLLNGLLDLTKLEEGKVELHVEPVDIRDLLQETQLELGSLLEEKNIRNTLQVGPENTVITADKGRLAQVIVNLFSNAIKFSPNSSLIEIVLSEAQTESGQPALQLTMLDEGPGIPENELGKIFDRFGQSSQTKAADGGAGLGLTICRELIALHGGRIWAANRVTGGAAMSFVIPRGGPHGHGEGI